MASPSTCIADSGNLHLTHHSRWFFQTPLASPPVSTIRGVPHCLHDTSSTLWNSDPNIAAILVAILYVLGNRRDTPGLLQCDRWAQVHRMRLALSVDSSNTIKWLACIAGNLHMRTKETNVGVQSSRTPSYIVISHYSYCAFPGARGTQPPRRRATARHPRRSLVVDQYTALRTTKPASGNGVATATCPPSLFISKYHPISKVRILLRMRSWRECTKSKSYIET